MPTFTPQDFVSKWKRVTSRVKQTYKEHFNDLCHLVNHQTSNEAAKELVEQRDRRLNVEGLSEAKKKKRTLTNLYNARPTRLDLAHKRLGEAVSAAYGWKSDLSDEEILEKLLSLNLERAKSIG